MAIVEASPILAYLLNEQRSMSQNGVAVNVVSSVLCCHFRKRGRRIGRVFSKQEMLYEDLIIHCGYTTLLAND